MSSDASKNPESAPMADTGIWEGEYGGGGNGSEYIAYTGKLLVSLQKDGIEEGISALQSGAGIGPLEGLATETDFSGAVDGFGSDDSIVLRNLSIAVVSPDEDQYEAVQKVGKNTRAIRSIERERVVYAFDSIDYWRGYRDGVSDAVGRVQEQGDVHAPAQGPAVQSWDESSATWGLQAIGAHVSPFTGAGSSIAILDTGMSLKHPDFSGRDMQVRSFVPGEDAEDHCGHGTHCAGVACGGMFPSSGPRYGVACEAQICSGKVLGNNGKGTDSQVLLGIGWAVALGCRVISMSLGSRVPSGAPYSTAFEDLASTVTEMNVLLVAAAGNSSRRPSMVSPVGHPANCPSILAVAAISPDFLIAPFSCGRDSGIGEVGIAAPGVSVYSSMHDSGHGWLSGTSMATPHVAGAALLAMEKEPGLQAAQIRDRLTSGALALPGSSPDDVGLGLVQAPRQ